MLRTWTFTPLCVTGPCAQVRLFRGRANAGDTLILTQGTPGHYSGTGLFFAPLKCAGTVYSPGEEVPFTINVQVTATTTAPDGTVLAQADQRDLRQQVPPEPDPVRDRPRPRLRALHRHLTRI